MTQENTIIDKLKSYDNETETYHLGTQDLEIKIPERSAELAIQLAARSSTDELSGQYLDDLIYENKSVQEAVKVPEVNVALTHAIEEKEFPKALDIAMTVVGKKYLEQKRIPEENYTSTEELEKLIESNLCYQ